MINKNINKEIAKLIIDNPELPIIARVMEDVVADNSCWWWFAGIEKAYVDEYTCFDDHYYVKGEIDVTRLSNDMGCKPKDIKWTKAIFVDVSGRGIGGR